MKSEVQKQRDGSPWGTVILILILAGIVVFSILFGCTKEEQHLLPDPIVGQWQRYLPWNADTVWTDYYYTFQRNGTGSEELTGQYVYDYRWTSSGGIIEITWDDGSGYSMPYEFQDGSNVTFFLKTGESYYRRKSR